MSAGGYLKYFAPTMPSSGDSGRSMSPPPFPGVIKAWHFHKIQTDYFCCIAGRARLVLYDPREGSPTRGAVMEFLLGPDNLSLVVIPPEVYHGFQCVSRDRGADDKYPHRAV